MASTRSRRGVRVRSPNLSDVEDGGGSDSDYSPGSLMIDMGAEDLEQLSSAPSSPPQLPTQPTPSITPHPNKGRRSLARRQYNTESNRMVFNGVTLLGQMNVVQSGHSQPVDRLDLYAYGWGDFFLDIIARRSNSLIPVKNIYEKVIPGLKRNVLSARISKLQVKSEALTEPYISAMKKLGLVVTGASHFVGIVDFIKICKYFHVQPPNNLTKYYAINSELNPEDVLRSFAADLNDTPTLPPAPGGGMGTAASGLSQELGSGVPGSTDGVLSLLSVTPAGLQGEGGRSEDVRPSSKGSVVGTEVTASPQQEEVDIRRLSLSGGGGVSVVVRAGKPYLLKVELNNILPTHSRDVLETIRRTYGVTVEHATKPEIGLLKNKGVVGAKAGRCALFSACDVCRMFLHWNTVAPQAFKELAEGKLPSEKLEDVPNPAPPPFSLPTYTFPKDDLSLPSFSTTNPSPLPTSTPSHPPTNTVELPHFTPPQPHNNPQHQTHTFLTPRLSHPPTVTSSQFPVSSLSPDQFQQPIQLLNSIQSPHPPSAHPPFSTSSHPPFSTSHPPFSTPSHPSFSTASHPPFSTCSHPPFSTSSHPPFSTSSHTPFSTSSHPPFSSSSYPPFSSSHSPFTSSHPPFSTSSHPLFSSPSHPPFSTPSHRLFPPSHIPQSNRSHSDRSMPPPDYSLPDHHPTQPFTNEPVGKPPVISGTDYSPVKMEGGGVRRRTSSSSGPSLDDQDLDYISMVWGESEVTLLCPPRGAEPFIAIPELVDKIFHNRSYVSAQRRSDLGIITVPATSLQMHVLRAKGSLDAFTGNTKLVSLSGAVKLAAVSNIQIPGTVILMIRKYCKEPLESIITPAGFAPATRPPSSQPSQSHYPLIHSSQPSHPPSSQEAHPNLPSRESVSYSTGVGGGKTVPQSAKRRASPTKQVVTSSNDESAASVSPLEGAPQHPDIIDPGPHFTNTGDGTYCLVRWGGHRLALLIGSQRVHYMGLYQVFQTLFKQYVTRMNFKMRMRKLEIKSIRAASSVRQALINLDALPQSSPVCGLIRVSEVERLARSYGVEPPQVLYDVFLLRHSDQKLLPNYSRLGVGRGRGDGKELARKSSSSTSANLLQSGQGPQGYQDAWDTPSLLQVTPQLGSTAYSATSQSSQFGQTTAYGVSQALPSGTSSSSQLHSMVITTAASDKNALTVSVPRQLLVSRFRLESRPVAPPGVMAGFHASLSRYPPVMSRGSVLHSLARKISQKSRKLGKGKTSGVGAVRCCPKCHFVNPASKKRCSRCEEFMVGRTCPECGTLNHNRTRECFKCNATIEEGHLSSPGEGEGYRGGQSEGEPSMSPESPLSPHFTPPPIRHAALKSMFPQEAGSKSEDSGVVTKTMFSGNLASSRKCVECGQLNSKMAKKCLQCKSPLQGRPCPQCNRPNHSHSTECYKCGHSLPCTATKWVYVGSNSNRIYRSQDSNNSTRLSTGLKNRAATVCLRCDRLRNSGQFTCGRCGDMYWIKPIVGTPAHGSSDQNDAAGTSHSHSKKKKAALEPNWNIPSEPDPEEIVSFASNLLCLEIGEGLLSLVNEAETKARETVHQAEEELEVVEEEYQACARRREEKEGILNDARAELDALIADVERNTQRLSQMEKEKEEATSITLSHPDTVSQLRERIECVLNVLVPPSTSCSTDKSEPTEDEPAKDISEHVEPKSAPAECKSEPMKDESEPTEDKSGDKPELAEPEESMDTTSSQ